METVPVVASDLLGTVGSVRAGFTTRHGGVSVGHHASLNLGWHVDDAPDRVAENWRRVSGRFGVDPANVAFLHQVHGNAVARIDAGNGVRRPAATADAAYTVAPNVALAICVADCVPVVVAGPGVIGVAHCGWRGTVAGVLPALLARMRDAVRRHAVEMRVAIGPHISESAYRVGDDVVSAFRASALDDAVVVRADRSHVDLGMAVRLQAQRAGVVEVEHVGGCSTEEAWFSHRRDAGKTGRFAGVVVRRC